MSGINEFINKLHKLEEAVDIILLTMESNEWTQRGRCPYGDKLSELKTKASQRQIRRDMEGKIHQEYHELKKRLSELETDYPQLRSE